MSDIISDEISKGLEPMFKEAKEKGLWFFCTSFIHPEVILSPKELKEKQKEGKFRWGAVNWRLRDPEEKVEMMNKEIKSLEDKRAKFIERIVISK